MAIDQPAANQAARTFDFVSSLGINTHIDSQTDGYQDLQTVAQAINFLGVTNIRDSAQSPDDARDWLQIANMTGARFDDYIAETSPAGMATDLGYAAGLAGEGIVNFIEGGNEEDDSFPASLGNNLPITALFQQTVYATGLALGIPVINMSFGAGWTPDNDYQGDYGAVGDLSGSANYANAHTYPNLGQSTDWSIQRLNGLAKLAASAAPVVTTEIGWSESDGFNQNDIAKYVVQAALDGMKDGDAKSYFYGLFDDSAGPFGLMNQDGTPKPAGVALHDLTTLLADPSPSAGTFAPGTLNYALSGTTAGDNTLLMEKSDGTYWLSLWNETDSAHDVTLTLGGTANEIAVYDPVSGTTAIQDVHDADSVTLSVSDAPRIVEIVGQGGSVAGAAAPDPTPAPNPTPAQNPESVSPPTVSSPAADPTAIALADTDAGPVVNDSDVSITATAGDHMLFIGGMNDAALLTGGTESVQAFQGDNSITTGAGDDTIAIAGTGNVVDAGAGANTIADSGGGNTIVMPGAGSGMDQIFGYVLDAGDTLDFSAALAGTEWDGSASTVGQFLQVGTSVNDAVISISDTANGSAVPVADLHDSGSVSMDSLLAFAKT